MSRRLWLSLRRLLQVHSSGDCGSPRVSGSTSVRRSSSKLASVSLRGLRPPPGRRTRSASGVSSARNSASQRTIVLRATPRTRMTALTPPCPADVATTPADPAIPGRRRLGCRETPPPTLVQYRSERLEALPYGRFVHHAKRYS